MAYEESLSSIGAGFAAYFALVDEENSLESRKDEAGAAFVAMSVVVALAVPLTNAFRTLRARTADDIVRRVGACKRGRSWIKM